MQYMYNQFHIIQNLNLSWTPFHEISGIFPQYLGTEYRTYMTFPFTVQQRKAK